MYLLNTVISSYEIADAVHVMQEADEHVIINVLKTEQFVGHFTGRLWVGVLLTQNNCKSR